MYIISIKNSLQTNLPFGSSSLSPRNPIALQTSITDVNKNYCAMIQRHQNL